MSDIVENLEIDRDIISADELEQQFNKKYNLLTETAVTLRRSYINKLSVTKSLKVAVSQQDNTIEVYELNNTALQPVCHLSGHDKTLTEVVFHPIDDFLLFSTGLDGLIKLWDTRANGACIQEYREESDCQIRPYECMDISDIGNVFCSGSQLVKEDSFIVFWDPRSADPLGGYWESHTDDVSQVKFKPNTNTVLASGGSDGLINIFNLVEQQEDEALAYSLNVENSVEKLTWLDGGRLSCITQSNDLQLWNTETGDMVKEYGRDKVARNIKRSRDDDCYLVDTYKLSDNTHCLLAGSHGGDGNVLRSLTISDKRLQPATDFNKNKQVVRCCHYDSARDLMITTGESGLISVWSADATADTKPTDGKINNRHHEHRHRPY
ncbi:WD repeat-containing protein 89 homolog [Zerene cesonia]|uniref:WD repeat-containing protein 89 homolog n=1 Tax=Zerene cesonia TaxID=33412 RepID=UPI0018E5638E|nr:WD repeat-containing protein 89 homolog [Zerene cesonia]